MEAVAEGAETPGEHSSRCLAPPLARLHAPASMSAARQVAATSACTMVTARCSGTPRSCASPHTNLRDGRAAVVVVDGGARSRAGDWPAGECPFQQCTTPQPAASSSSSIDRQQQRASYPAPQPNNLGGADLAGSSPPSSVSAPSWPAEIAARTPARSIASRPDSVRGLTCARQGDWARDGSRWVGRW